MTKNDQRRWTDGLSEEDLAFLKRFLLCSGSLKELASIYNISYPTVRLRLDRLIQKVKIVDSETVSSEFERVLRALYADAKFDAGTMKEILSAYRKDLEASRWEDGQ